MKDKNIKLTDNAQKQLDQFRDEQVRKLLDIIVNSKSYPGVEDVEITGNDIAQYGKQIIFLKRKRSPFLQILAWSYLLVGIIVISYGIFYDRIEYMIKNNPVQLLYIILGSIMVFISILVLLRDRFRRKVIEKYSD